MENNVNPKPGEAIPTEEIKRMVDVLISVAKAYPPDSAMHQMSLLRAEHYMDLVDSWRKSMLPVEGPDPRD